MRGPLRVRERSSRTLDQRLALRFPRLAAASARLIAGLPPRSRVRRAALWRAVRLGIEAYNRRDLDAVVIGWNPEFEYRPARNVVEGGLAEPSYRGTESYRRYVAATAEAWGADVHIDPLELIDLGDRFVMLADVPMRAQASGVPLTEAFALVWRVEGRRVARVEEYFGHAEALEAVGLQR